jgi:hypothetical protein
MMASEKRERSNAAPPGSWIHGSRSRFRSRFRFRFRFVGSGVASSGPSARLVALVKQCKPGVADEHVLHSRTRRLFFFWGNGGKNNLNKHTHVRGCRVCCESVDHRGGGADDDAEQDQQQWHATLQQLAIQLLLSTTYVMASGPGVAGSCGLLLLSSTSPRSRSPIVQALDVSSQQ